MIIDLILDRKQCEDDYNPISFAAEIHDYARTFEDDETQTDIFRAMCGKSENRVKGALCTYIRANGYNPDLCNYIWSVSWLPAWWDMEH